MFSKRRSKGLESDLLAATISVMLVCQKKPFPHEPLHSFKTNRPREFKSTHSQAPEPKTQVPPLFHLHGTEGQQCNGGLSINNIFYIFTKPDSALLWAEREIHGKAVGGGKRGVGEKERETERGMEREMCS